MGRLGRVLEVIFGPTQRWVFVLIIARKPTRGDLPPTEDFFGPLPYNKVAVYSSPEKAMHAAAWEAALEAHKVKEDPETEPSDQYLKWQWATEKTARSTALVELARPRAKAAKEAMLKPASWRRYESTDGKIVWVFEGPVAFDYRIIANRVDRWAELPSDTPVSIKREFE
jgi:hypothetical protein